MNPTYVKVRQLSLSEKSAAEVLSTLDTVCGAGAQCPAVQASPAAAATLVALQAALASAHVSVGNRMSLAQALMAAIQIQKIDIGTLRTALVSYQAAVGSIPGLTAALIGQAGLLSRDPKSPPAALGNVTGVNSKPGKRPMEGILAWPEVAGATGYAIELNTTPQGPTGTWTAIASGSSRRRVVMGPAPASQILARVAAVASDGTQSEWSSPVLVTTA